MLPTTQLTSTPYSGTTMGGTTTGDLSTTLENQETSDPMRIDVVDRFPDEFPMADMPPRRQDSAVQRPRLVLPGAIVHVDGPYGTVYVLMLRLHDVH